MPSVQKIRYELGLEVQYLISNLVLGGVSIFGAGRIGSKIRSKVLKNLGFNIGPHTLIRSGFKFSGHCKRLKLGSNSSINFNALFDLMGFVEIGDYCQIGPNVSFITSSHVLTSDFQSRRADRPSKVIRLEDFVWIGANVTILPGVTIGKGAVIAAGSLVNKDVPPESVYGGIPAKLLQKL